MRDLDNRIEILAAKAELKAEQDKITKLQAFDSRFFLVKVILNRMIVKRIWFFSHCTHILKRLKVVIIF